MTRSTIAAALAAIVLSAAPVAAQTPAASSTKGFFIGAHLNGSEVTFDEADFEEESSNGGGLGLQLGYGFTPQFALFADLTAAGLEDETAFGHFDFGVRYAFTSPTRRWVPSIDAAITGRVLARDDAEFEGETADVELFGGGFTLGVGLQYYTAPSWAIGAAVKWTSGEFDSFRVDNVTIDGLEIDATSTRFNIGVTWFPQARR